MDLKNLNDDELFNQLINCLKEYNDRLHNKETLPKKIIAKTYLNEFMEFLGRKS